MYPKIKNKAIQALNNLRVQVIFIMRFIVNEMYSTAINVVTRLFNDPNARLILVIAIVLVVAFTIGIGSDHGG